MADRPATIRVMLADDHAIFREGVRLLLEQDGGVAVVAEAAKGAEVLDAAAAARPDVLLVDFFMGGLAGLDLFGRVRSRCPGTKVLVFSEYLSDELVVQCLRTGARGYQAKTGTLADLLRGIQTVHGGGLWAESRLLARALEKGPAVTRREHEIISQISAGRRNREIAAALGISEKTVKVHLHNIFRKLKVEHRVQVALYNLGVRPAAGDR
jgi:DNA-binding NarL/FixJ family response regulator